jgi:hypothetical protein
MDFGDLMSWTCVIVSGAGQGSESHRGARAGLYWSFHTLLLMNAIVGEFECAFRRSGNCEGRDRTATVAGVVAVVATLLLAYMGKGAWRRAAVRIEALDPNALSWGVLMLGITNFVLLLEDVGVVWTVVVVLCGALWSGAWQFVRVGGAH